MEEEKKGFLHKELLTRIMWLIRLRWLAIGGVFCTLVGAKYFLHVPLPFFSLYCGTIILFLFNVMYLFHFRGIERAAAYSDQEKKSLRFANFQISIDLLMLVVLIHFSGGMENPFIFYFVFHMIIASILLSNRAAYFQAIFTTVLVGINTIFEFTVPSFHYHLNFFIPGYPCRNTIYLAGLFLIFASTLFLSVYMATSIVNRLRERESELAAANECLEEQDRIKSQYVWTVAHDIQSPLATIQSCLKVVLSSFAGELPLKARDMIDRAEGRTLYLLHFTKDLLNLSRIKSSRQLPKEGLQLLKIAENIMEDVKMKIAEKGLVFTKRTMSGLPDVYGNKDEMEQLLLNLIVNAIKYTPEGGKVGLQMKEEEGCVRVEISDTGIGIPQEDVTHIFDEFYRAKNVRSMAGEGTGLGLSIVRQIIKDHDGKIWVESKVGEGTKFTFLLPVSHSIT